MDSVKYIEFMETVVSHRMILDIKLNKDGKNNWRGEGGMTFSGTRDGENWGQVNLIVAANDKTSELASATVMLALSNYVNSDDFMEEVQERIINSELDEVDEDTNG